MCRNLTYLIQLQCVKTHSNFTTIYLTTSGHLTLHVYQKELPTLKGMYTNATNVVCKGSLFNALCVKAYKHRCFILGAAQKACKPLQSIFQNSLKWYMINKCMLKLTFSRISRITWFVRVFTIHHGVYNQWAVSYQQMLMEVQQNIYIFWVHDTVKSKLLFAWKYSLKHIVYDPFLYCATHLHHHLYLNATL